MSEGAFCLDYLSHKADISLAGLKVELFLLTVTI